MLKGELATLHTNEEETLMDTIGEDGTGSKENCRQAEGTSGKSKSNPLCSLLKNYLRHPGKRTFDLTTGGTREQGGVGSVCPARLLGSSAIRK